MESIESSYFTPEETYLFCLAEANDKYRHGKSPISDAEYDYLATQTAAHDITNYIGTGLTLGLVLFYLGHTQEDTYMTHSRRNAITPNNEKPTPKPAPPSVFEAVLNDYQTYKKEHWAGHAAPDKVPYDMHRRKQVRAWDSDAKQMDYAVRVVDGKILIKADADEDPTTWAPEETAIIAGVYYFAMALDGFFTLMDDASVHDSLGNLLYEGDRVQASDGQVLIVVFDSHWRRWVLSTAPAVEWTPATVSISANYAVVTKRIGNIYQG
jgi:hypothetical protein